MVVGRIVTGNERDSSPTETAQQCGLDLTRLRCAALNAHDQDLLKRRTEAPTVCLEPTLQVISLANVHTLALKEEDVQHWSTLLRLV